MKQKSILYEIIIFSLIFIFLIIPPLLTTKVSDYNLIFNWNFPWQQAGFCIFAVVLYILSRKMFEPQRKFFYPSMLCLALLIFSAIIIKLISSKIGSQAGIPGKIYLPDTAFEGVCCFLFFVFGSVYEEMIYRFYFIDALKRLLSYTKMPDGKLMFFITEGLGLLVFAFGHLYLGILAVINAAIAHCVLRILYKKTGLIWNGVLIHFVYNIISLILL